MQDNVAKRLVQISLPIGPEERVKRQRNTSTQVAIPRSNTSCINFKCNVTVCDENKKGNTIALCALLFSQSPLNCGIYSLAAQY